MALSQSVSDYNMVAVDAEFMDMCPIAVGPFSHLHFTCEEQTPADVASRLQSLLVYLNGSFDNRFRRLVDDPRSLQVIQREIPHLVRPDQWRSVADWAVNFVAKAGGRRWGEVAAHEKCEVMAFAMLTGRAQGSVHVDAQQAGNFVDSMDGARTASARRAMMDDRSNPETCQVSRVAALLRVKYATSLCTVTLMRGADGQSHQSDLDLQTKVGGKELYYGSKRVGDCQLNFEANASAVERNPAENISLNQAGAFVFRVNNYINRDNADVPFEITAQKPGFTEVHAGVWPRSRKNGDFVTAEDLTGAGQALRGRAEGARGE
ncbi:unnamed protein product [Prorocentrum cordatum]|uniref:Uncharacterized protein n=1 Tax=Prorocentrum cordatum TaxID=2364126 RepID=A0ABN9SUP8_9DINO|nr:unnamed protein product [Polarella glacialis]